MKSIWAAFILVMCMGMPSAHAAGIESGPKRVALVELYSSEGCSSCPPADRWFRGLRGKPGLWKEFVPAVFHVTYWDYLGWKDALARPEYTQRQHEYAASWRTDTVYTPGVVLDGKAWRGWQQADHPPAGTENAGILRADASEAARTYKVRFEPAQPIAGELKVYGALLGFDIEHAVTRGENRGRDLRHDFVVLEMKAFSLRQEGAGYEADVRFAYSGEEAAGGVAFWVQAGGMEPLQAAGGFI